MALYARITPILAALAIGMLLLQCAMEPSSGASSRATLDTCQAPACYPDPRPPRP